MVVGSHTIPVTNLQTIWTRSMKSCSDNPVLLNRMSNTIFHQYHKMVSRLEYTGTKHAISNERPNIAWASLI